MPDQKISQLTDGGNAQAADEFVVARSGANYRIDGASVAAAATSVGTLTSLTVSGLVSMTGTSSLKATNTANTSGFEIGLLGGTSDATAFIYQRANSGLAFGTNNATRMVLEASGNLAVDTNTLYVDAANNRVGVGTASPSDTLHVVGKFRGVADATTSNTANYGFRFSTATNTDRVLWGGYDNSANVGFIQATELNVAHTNLVLNPNGGNLGLGVTPSAWGSAFRGLQVGSYPAFATSTGNDTIIGNNWYNNAGDKRINAGYAARMYFGQSTNGGFVWQTAGTSTADSSITFTSAMTLDASGNLGVGTTSPNIDGGSARALTLNSTGGARLELASSGTRYAQFFAGTIGAYITAYTAIPLVFEVNGSERARITSGGQFLVGKTTVDATVVGSEMRPNGSIVATRSETDNTASTLDVYSTGAAAYRFYVGMAGTVYATNTTISAISDARLKENIRDLDVGLDAILALKPRKYDWKEGKGQDKKDVRGFIAQEFETVFPDLIDEWKDPAPEGEEPYRSVRQDLIPVLVKAIQELDAKNKALEARLEALEA